MRVPERYVCAARGKASLRPQTAHAPGRASVGMQHSPRAARAMTGSRSGARRRRTRGARPSASYATSRLSWRPRRLTWRAATWSAMRRGPPQPQRPPCRTRPPRPRCPHANSPASAKFSHSSQVATQGHVGVWEFGQPCQPCQCQVHVVCNEFNLHICQEIPQGPSSLYLGGISRCASECSLCLNHLCTLCLCA